MEIPRKVLPTAKKPRLPKFPTSSSNIPPLSPPPLTSSYSLPPASSQPLAPSPNILDSRLSPPHSSSSFRLPTDFFSSRDPSSNDPRLRSQMSHFVQQVQADFLDEMGDAMKVESARRRRVMQQQHVPGSRPLAIEGKSAFLLSKKNLKYLLSRVSSSWYSAAISFRRCSSLSDFSSPCRTLSDDSWSFFGGSTVCACLSADVVNYSRPARSKASISTAYRFARPSS